MEGDRRGISGRRRGGPVPEDAYAVPVRHAGGKDKAGRAERRTFFPE